MAYRDSHRACPVCAGAFEEVRVGPRRFHRCEQCGGVWLEWATFQSMWSQMLPHAAEPALTARGREGGRARQCPSRHNWFRAFMGDILKMS